MELTNIISVTIKVLNRSSVFLMLAITIYNGIILKQDDLLTNNWKGKLILLSLSLAASTGLIEFVLQQFKESVPSLYTVMATILGGIVLFVLMATISLLYLKAGA